MKNSTINNRSLMKSEQITPLKPKNMVMCAITLLMTVMFNSEATAQASLAADIFTGSNGGFPESLAVYDNKLYFGANDGTNGVELWSYDGTTASLAADIRSGSSSSNPKGLTVFNNELYFGANDGINGFELWSYDGTTASLAADIRPGSDDSSTEDLKVLGNKLYFRAEGESVGTELWSYDGTSAALAADIISGSDGGFPEGLAVYDNKLYFSADDGTNGTELWSYDGTTASLVADIRTGSSGSNPRGFIVYGNKLYFRANDGTNGTELWSYDGTTASLVANIMPGVSSSNPGDFTIFNGLLYFSAQNSANGLELRSFDGTTVSLAVDIVPGSGSSGVQSLAVYNNKLFFNATDGTSGFELWSYDGTTASLAADIRTGTGSSNPSELTVFDNKLYFRANDGTNGTELWVYEEVLTATTWDGSTSNDWNTAANWNTNAVPTSSDDVIIPAAPSNQPVVTSDPGAPAECAALTVENGASLTIGSGKALTVGGDTQNDGTILIEADATGIGSFIDNGTITGSGSFQMQQYLTGSGGTTPDGVFYYVSSPVASATSNVYDAAGTDRLWSADEVNTEYPEITDNSTSLNVGQGYIARLGATGTKTFTGGAFNTGNITAGGLTRTGTTDLNRGYNLVGNPYPSTVNWDDLGRTNLETTMWYRTNNGGTMTFDTYNATGMVGTNNNGGGTVDGTIPPTQAFWVRVDADGNTGSLAFENADRTHGTLGGIYKAESEEGTIRLSLSNGTIGDEQVIYFDASANDALDDYDSRKFWAAGIPQLYSNLNEDTLTINGLNSPMTTQMVPLGMKIPSQGNYNLDAVNITLVSTPAWLEDTYLNVFQDLNNDPNYSFTSEAGNIGDRFILHFNNAMVGVEEAEVASHVFAANGQLNISLSPNSENANLQVLDMAGRTIATRALDQTQTVMDMNVPIGIYLVRIETTKGTDTHQIIIN